MHIFALWFYDFLDGTLALQLQSTTYLKPLSPSALDLDGVEVN